MQLETKHFGTIEVDEKGIIEFENGLPGFEQVKRFILLSKEEEVSPLRWIQSVDSPGVAFIVADPFMIKKDYEIDIDEEALKKLRVENAKDIMVLSIVVVPEDTTEASMNLKAPIVINTREMRGMQIVLDTNKYSVRHYIMEELRKQEVAANVGTDKEEGSVYCNK